MKNRAVARLDRFLKRRGEPVTLYRTVGVAVQSNVTATVNGIVRTFSAQQLIAGLTQQNYLVVLSPTDLRKQGWPGGVAARADGTPLVIGDPAIPKISDKIAFRGQQRSITMIAPVYDGAECVRIELKVVGG
jgi:hypothetical protein